MKTVNIHDAKTNFSKLLTDLEKSGDGIVICRNGKPVADLILHKKANRTKTHPVLSKIQINYNPAEPADIDEWPESAR